MQNTAFYTAKGNLLQCKRQHIGNTKKSGNRFFNKMGGNNFSNNGFLLIFAHDTEYLHYKGMAVQNRLYQITLIS